MVKNSLKILCCEHRVIFKVCLATFQHYAWKANWYSGWKYFSKWHQNDMHFNPLSANPTKRSKTFKQFVGKNVDIFQFSTLHTIAWSGEKNEQIQGSTLSKSSWLIQFSNKPPSLGSDLSLLWTCNCQVVRRQTNK